MRGKIRVKSLQESQSWAVSSQLQRFPIKNAAIRCRSKCNIGECATVAPLKWISHFFDASIWLQESRGRCRPSPGHRCYPAVASVQCLHNVPWRGSNPRPRPATALIGNGHLPCWASKHCPNDLCTRSTKWIWRRERLHELPINKLSLTMYGREARADVHRPDPHRPRTNAKKNPYLYTLISEHFISEMVFCLFKYCTEIISAAPG